MVFFIIIISNKLWRVKDGQSTETDNIEHNTQLADENKKQHRNPKI